VGSDNSIISLNEESSQIMNVERLTPPELFGVNNTSVAINAFYISDLHLPEHLMNKGIALDDKVKVIEYIDEIVSMLINSSNKSTIASCGLTPDNEKDLLLYDYELFEALNYKLSKKELSEWAGNLYSGKNNKPVEPSIKHCLLIAGDISSDIDLFKLFFERLFSRIRRKTKHCAVFLVLGNHEYSNFYSLEEAYYKYNKFLSNYNVILLNNSLVEFGNCIVVGGTGFAKHNESYNANTLIGPGCMRNNRELEAIESDKFNQCYEDALIRARKKKKPLIVLTHYPVKDWINGRTDGNCYYFSGHNHQNEIVKEDDCHIFADNQIGYRANRIHLKRALLGTSYNPFYNYDDGYYKITMDQYIDYKKYEGEYIGIEIIEKQIQKEAQFYLIKKNGFYGFFFIDKFCTKICSGGAVKKISDIIEIEYFYETFNEMVNTYLRILKPYRKLQEKIASEIKQLNLPEYCSGRIHGAIVDFDFYHHVMINPIDGTISVYYSPAFGLVQKIDSLNDLIGSIETNGCLRQNKGKIALAKKADNLPVNSVIRKSFGEVREKDKELQRIQIGDSVYAYSRIINQLQRLFTSGVLREWNDDLLDEPNLVEIREKYRPKQKYLSPYQMVQKHWKNLMLYDSNVADVSLVKCALMRNRRSPFPFLDARKKYGRYIPQNRISDEEIREYINHIHESVLEECFDDFYYLLGFEIIKYYPLRLISKQNLEEMFSGLNLNNKRIIETVSHIPFPDWTDDFKMVVTKSIILKNKPAYCSKELWKMIR